jgi:hypothetical protein
MKKQILAAVGGVLLTASLAAGAQIVVRIGPPPPRPVEVVPVAPGPDWAWHPGYHRWDGHGYVWVAGHYEHPPYAHAHWVEGHWANHGGGWVWHEGHWAR